MTSIPVLMYAELLPNIRQISVLAALETPFNSSTNVKLSDNGKQFNLFHNGQSYFLQLPGQTNSSFPLQKPATGSKELSWRLPWAAPKNHAIMRQESPTYESPWSAKSMNTSSELSCRTCGKIIIEKESIKVWKDLPSEDWAEMMDFWHCHKPDDEPDHIHSCSSTEPTTPCKKISSEDTLTGRGYGANSHFSAQLGVGLIDIATFLFAEKDCTKIRIEKPNITSPHGKSSANCFYCQNELGYYDANFLGVKLWKWKLQNVNQLLPIYTLSSSSTAGLPHVHTNSVSIMQSNYPASIFVTSKILSKMASHLVSKFLLIPGSSSKNSNIVLLWVFSAALRFSYSSLPSKSSHSFGLPGLKVFWKLVAEEQVDNVRDKVGIEELILPLEVVLEMEMVLKNSSFLLPPSSREYLDWNVGLLERYEE